MAFFDITKDNFEDEVIKSETPVLVDFWAPWCVYCVRLTPMLEEVMTEQGEKLRIGKINIDDEPELAAQFGVTAIPTLTLIKDGEISGDPFHPASKADIDSFLEAQGV